MSGHQDEKEQQEQETGFGFEIVNVEDTAVMEDDVDIVIETIKSKTSKSSKKPDGDEDELVSHKEMIKYHFNWIGLAFTMGSIVYYGQMLVDQYNGEIPTVHDDIFPIKIVFKMRYILGFIYCVLVLLRRSFVFEARNAEAPLIVSCVLEIYYAFTQKPADEGPSVLKVAIPLLLTLVACLRRKAIWRIVLNPWTKDKTELIDFMKLARKSSVGII